jgi:membrane fusion protein, multidrug efflux system
MSSQYTYESSLGRRRAAAPILACAALFLGGCHRQPPPSAPPAPVVALPVHPLTGRASLGELHFPVEVAARYANARAFRVGGQIIARSARLGDVIHRGQVIARLDPTDAQKQLGVARAARDAAEHRLVFARQTLDRDQDQRAQNLIAVNELEQSENDYAAALAGQTQARNQWEVAHNALGYTGLVAEHDGVITSENADTGQVVAAGQAVYGLAWSGDLDVTLDAAASDLGAVAAGQMARVTFPALPGRQFTGRVREISPAADPQSRTYRIKLTLVDGSPEVRLGMTGDAALAPGAPTGPDAASGRATFKVPATALFHRGRDPAVWVVRARDSTLELRPVTVAAYTEHAITVSGGLSDGDTVVLAGVHTVYEGEHVAAVKPLFSDEEDAPAAVAAAP